jgi:hypothetical protein
MTKISKKKIIPVATLMVVISVGSFLMLGGGRRAYAANLTTISDTMSRIKVSEAANHTIEFVTPTGVDASTDTITLTFDDTGDSFDFGSVSEADIDLAVDDDGGCDGTWTDKTVAAAPGAGSWGASVNATNDVITLTAPSDATTGEITAGVCVQIEIGTNAANGGAGTNQITNPSVAATYVVDIAGTFGDSGAYEVDIVSDDQIQITASVDPTLDVVFSSNTCALGVLSSTTIETCSYDITVSTNSTNGYEATIVEDGDLRNAVDSIADAGGTVTAGTEGYGVGTSKAGQTITQNAACTDGAGGSQSGSSLTGTEQQFASATGPVSSDATTMCHLASVSGATPAGSYSQTATIIVTASY